MTTHVHQSGLLDLRFAPGPADRTVLVGRRQRFPLRTTTAMYPDDLGPGMPFVIVQNPSGGTFPGDRLRQTVHVAARGSAHVRGQSASKIHAGPGTPAESSVELVLEPDSVLEYFPGAIIPHTAARYRQTVDVVAARNAQLITAETLAAGRLAYGERFAFEDVRLELSISMGGDLVCRDVLHLVPKRFDPKSRGSFGGYSYLSTVVGVSAHTDPVHLVRAVDDAVGAVGVSAAATLLPGNIGVIVRALTDSAGGARAVVDAAWNAIRLIALGRPCPNRIG